MYITNKKYDRINSEKNQSKTNNNYRPPYHTIFTYIK